MQLCFVQALAQIIIGFEALPKESAVDEESARGQQQQQLPSCSEAEDKLLKRLWKQSCELTGRSPTDIPENFGQQVKYKVQRFLRCSALFFHFYSDIPLPKNACSFDDLCHYLGLNPDLSVMLKTKGLQEIMEG